MNQTMSKSNNGYCKGYCLSFLMKFNWRYQSTTCRFILHTVALSLMFANAQCLILRETFVDKNSIQLKHKQTCSVAYILLANLYFGRQSKNSLHNTPNKTVDGISLLVLVIVQMKHSKRKRIYVCYNATQSSAKRCRTYFLFVAHTLTA